jgi:CBS domain-containing protein
MKKGKVNEIMLPYKQGLPLSPCLTAHDPITHAVKVMLKYEMNQIAVVRNIRPIGMIRIDDALKKLGLDHPLG